MKTYSKSWLLRKLSRIKKDLGVSQKELAQILDIDEKNLRRIVRTTSARVKGEIVPFEKIDKVIKFIKVTDITLKKDQLKIWIRDKSIPIYDGAAPIDYMKNGDFELPLYTLVIQAIIFGD